MNKFIFIILIIFSLIANANDKNEINYDLIIEVSSKRQGAYLIRYYQTLRSTCLGYLDIIVFSENNADGSTKPVISSTKPICHLFNKEIATEYIDVDIDKIEFEEDLVRLHLNYTPAREREFGVYKTECTVKVSDGKFGDLVCKEGERLSDDEVKELFRALN